MNYHLIDGKAYSFDAFGGIYAVKQNDFEKQMWILKEHNIKVASLNDIIDNKVKEDFCVALTFDDGNPSDYNIVFPILKQFGFTATFFLSIQNLKKNDVSWKQYIEMKSHKFTIGSHGISHRDLSVLSIEEIATELKESKRIIESSLNNTLRFFSLPFGMYNSKVIKCAKLIAYDAILTTQFNHVFPSRKSFVLDRWSIKRKTSISDFKKIIQNKKWIVFKYKFVSAIKKGFLVGFGSTLINKVYTIKKQYLG